MLNLRVGQLLAITNRYGVFLFVGEYMTEKIIDKYRGFKAELATIETFEEIRFLEIKSKAIAEFAKRDGIGKEEQNQWGRFRVEIMQKKGVWLDEHFPHGNIKGKSRLSSRESSLKDEGITPDESSDSRLSKDKPDIANKVMEEIEGKGDVITPNKVASGIRQNKKIGRLEEEEEKRKGAIVSLDLRRGNFKEVLSEIYNINAIITDPPYSKEFIECFSELSLFSKEHLADNGFCVVYSGQYHLPEVINRLSEHLTYVWTFCLYHVGKKQLINGINIMCGWKPVLIFSNGKKRMRFSAYDVLISEEREKNSHKWQQSESGVEKLIEIFTSPGELIVDPFAGSGTFLKVGHDMKRNVIGAEINDTTEK